MHLVVCQSKWKFLHVRHNHRTRHWRNEQYSPVGYTSLAFYCTEGVSEQRAEIWTKRSTFPAASVATPVEALALYGI